MQRFFFDVASHSCVRYDYQGREFANLDEARDFAELIAIDMGCSEDTEQAGEIQVRDIRGVELFSVKVQTSTLVAA